MTYSVSFGFTGGKELEELLNQMQIDFGEKDAKNILTSAVRTAMKPVLDTAKALVPVDTGLLRRGLWIEARRPRAKDFRSKYVKKSDCCMIHVITRTPTEEHAPQIIIAPPPSPAILHKNKIEEHIKEIMHQNEYLVDLGGHLSSVGYTILFEKMYEYIVNNNLVD